MDDVPDESPRGTCERNESEEQRREDEESQLPSRLTSLGRNRFSPLRLRKRDDQADRQDDAGGELEEEERGEVDDVPELGDLQLGHQPREEAEGHGQRALEVGAAPAGLGDAEERAEDEDVRHDEEDGLEDEGRGDDIPEELLQKQMNILNDAYGGRENSPPLIILVSDVTSWNKIGFLCA